MREAEAQTVRFACLISVFNRVCGIS